MVRVKTVVSLLAAMLFVVACGVRAGEASSTEIDQLKKDVADLKRKLNDQRVAPVSKGSVERAMEKYGPDANVTTKFGKLTIGGLLQVWYVQPQRDTRGLFTNNATGTIDSNSGQDNSTFRIRRSELRFTMEIHENITAVIMIDPAAEAASFPGYPDNQSQNGTVFKTVNNVSPEFDAANGPGLGSTNEIANVQSGAGTTPRLLEDAYIQYHGVIPHHDVQIGQFHPAVGEEGIRSSAELDFIERSMIGQINWVYDMGVSVHGKWWNDRFQYWLAAFDGAGNYFGSAGLPQNRADDNSSKDFNYRVLVRPLWEDECYGSLELGFSGIMGSHGKDGTPDPIATPVAGLNRRSVWASKMDPWLMYKAGGPVKGWWIRGEMLWMKDRMAPDSVMDLSAGGAAEAFAQDGPRPVSVNGGTVSTGYKIADSIFCDSAPSWMKPFEIAFRYERFQNVLVSDSGIGADAAGATATNVYYTTVATGGLNYYIRKNNAKIQLNGNYVREPSSVHYGFHGTNNSNIALNFQVAF